MDKQLTCPHCGHLERDAWEIDFGPGDSPYGPLLEHTYYMANPARSQAGFGKLVGKLGCQRGWG